MRDIQPLTSVLEARAGFRLGFMPGALGPPCLSTIVGAKFEPRHYERSSRSSPGSLSLACSCMRHLCCITAHQSSLPERCSCAGGLASRHHTLHRVRTARRVLTLSSLAGLVILSWPHRRRRRRFGFVDSRTRSAMRRSPNHRAALDPGRALCYTSNLSGPARVSAGRWVGLLCGHVY